jgi:hypothetical protein
VRNGLEQLVGPSQQGAAVIHVIAPNVGGIHGHEFALAMLAHHSLAQVFHTNLQSPAAGRAFLDEVSGIWHDLPPVNQAPLPDDKPATIIRHLPAVCQRQHGHRKLFGGSPVRCRTRRAQEGCVI